VRIGYRARQFWHALTAAPQPEDLEQARQALSPQLMGLFLKMQPGEQAHSLEVYRRLRILDEINADLLAAALLHDVGKSRCRLQVWDRATIVLAKAVWGERVRDWGQASPRGWRRPFVVAEQHAAWGAEMADQAGASPLTVTLIRRHQDLQDGFGNCDEDDLLYRLQRVDDES
jgi:putative nucleotidyltransferase with HDIG domain